MRARGAGDASGFEVGCNVARKLRQLASTLGMFAAAWPPRMARHYPVTLTERPGHPSDGTRKTSDASGALHLFGMALAEVSLR